MDEDFSFLTNTQLQETSSFKFEKQITASSNCPQQPSPLVGRKTAEMANWIGSCRFRLLQRELKKKKKLVDFLGG